MPTQSKKSKASTRKRKAEGERRITLGVLLMRYMPIEMTCIVFILALSLHVRWWPLEFVVSFTPQILILLWVYLLVYATIGTWFMFLNGFDGLIKRVGKFSASLFGVGAMLGVYVLAYSINVVTPLNLEPELSFRSDRLTVGTFNKLYRSDNFAKDANLITAAKADVFSLQEVRRDEIEFLRNQLNHDYSYTTECGCSADDTEVALLSRYPIINARTIYEHPNAVIARTVIDSDDLGKFVVYIVHMHVPYQQADYNLRDDAYAVLNDAINAEALPTFAVGDFNTTVYSPDMQRFSSDASRIRNVVDRSWPQCTWFGSFLNELACARIDYVFAPKSSTVHSLEIGDQTHSDHRSVVVEVTL